jgi:hypothetical protein
MCCYLGKPLGFWLARMADPADGVGEFDVAED